MSAVNTELVYSSMGFWKELRLFLEYGFPISSFFQVIRLPLGHLRGKRLYRVPFIHTFPSAGQQG